MKYIINEAIVTILGWTFMLVPFGAAFYQIYRMVKTIVCALI